jgi:hypothetical protein
MPIPNSPKKERCGRANASKKGYVTCCSRPAIAFAREDMRLLHADLSRAFAACAMLRVDMRDADVIETELMEISAMADDGVKLDASSPGVRCILAGRSENVSDCLAVTARNQARGSKSAPRPFRNG